MMNTQLQYRTLVDCLECQEDLKEDVDRLVRTELLGVQEDRDCQEGQVVLDNQEKVVYR